MVIQMDNSSRKSSTYRKDSGTGILDQNGVNMRCVFETEEVKHLITATYPGVNEQEYPSTVLLASAGSALWKAMNQNGLQFPDPVDTFSTKVAIEYATEHLQAEFKFLYPSNEYLVSLPEFGKLAGWGHMSPLRVGIHPKYGTWFAYRVLMLLSVKLPPTEREETEHPCLSCIDKPCQPACPASAVNEIGDFNLDKCFGYRDRQDSPCARLCQSRIRCPVGSEYQYTKDQINYFYDRSLVSLKWYFKSNSHG